MQTAAGTRIGPDEGAADLEPLVCAIAAGEKAALHSLYERTVAQVFAIATSMLRSKEDAEEIVCDVYTHAWQRAGTYDAARGSVIAWLGIMARNRAIDRLRQRRDAVSLDDERYQGLADSLCTDHGPEQVLARFQSGSAVHRALEALTPQRRHLVSLAFFQGLSHQEIADSVGMPLGTVKSHVRRALCELQIELGIRP